MKRSSLALAFAALTCAVPFSPIAAPLTAQTTGTTAGQTALEMRAEQVVAVVNGELPPEEVFTQGFLHAVPPSQLAAISQQLTSQFGRAVAVESLAAPDGTRSALAMRMERAIAKGGIAIDPADSNRISELRFANFEPINDTPDKIEADLSALPGEVSWWFGPLNGGRPVMANRANDTMPVASTFKLYVLATLASQVAQGERKWDDVVLLEEPRSFPSGTMQDWPHGASVTLETLASMMISISDNTATDQLIHILGREAIYQTMFESGHSNPQLNNPLLTTREMFLLKSGPEGRATVFIRGEADVREQILDGLLDLPISADQVQSAFVNGPRQLGIEWFASASDLTRVLRYMRRTADPRAFAIMAINTSTNSDTEKLWNYIGYKGGSEPGVLNLTWLLTDKNGRDHALILSWTNQEENLDEDALELIALRILQLPR